MSKKILIIIVIALAAIVGASSFYGGMKYANSKNPMSAFRGSAADFANLSQGERHARFQQFGTAGAAGGAQKGMRTGGGVTGGEIISKDDPAGEQAPYGASKSITIKLPDGGSKIIFFSDATQITKSSFVSPTDLKVGESVTATGNTNSDGSITAQTIQLRPAAVNPAAK